ncbi:hypothetical protein O181_131328 [Austropuccinia psidii MF-1]|uniref:Uncharacterized protein n=1 Tax=Austropuccinia psidii MF-1 TaxID=1389203 RepID=A0A9Q3L098_9BASI|nr:hypothetical protein [Austropuccinia psidii MF-1]
MTPRQPLRYYYFLEEKHSTLRSNDLTEDSEKIIVLRHGGIYLCPNSQIVPTQGPKSSKELVRPFSKEQENFKNKMMEQSNPPPKN